MKNHLMALICLTSILIFSSCFSSTIISEVSYPDTTTEGENTISKTMHTYLWGAVTDTETTDLCPSGTLRKVEVKTNVLSSLMNVLSLGIYHRTIVECTCAKVIED